MAREDLDGEELTIDHLLRTVEPGRETIVDLTKQYLEDGKEKVSVTFGQRTLQPEQPLAPIRDESPARKHTFATAGGLVEYLKKYGGADTVVLADLPNQVIGATLDEQAAEGRELVTLRPIDHPLFVPWKQLLGRKVAVTDFALVIMQYRRSVVGPISGIQLAMLFSQITAESKVTLNRGVGKKSLNAVSVATDISGTIQNVPTEIPDTLVIEAPLFIGSESVKLEIDLLCEMRDEKVTVFMSAATLADAVSAQFDEMLEILKRELPDIVIDFGTITYESWKYRTK